MESLWLGSILQSAMSPFLSRCLGHGKKWSNTVRLRKEAADCVTMNIMYLHLWNINFVIYYVLWKAWPRQMWSRAYSKMLLFIWCKQRENLEVRSSRQGPGRWFQGFISWIVRFLDRRSGRQAGWLGYWRYVGESSILMLWAPKEHPHAARHHRPLALCS